MSKRKGILLTNPAYRGFYFCAWKDAWSILLTRGYQPDEEKAERANIIRETLGQSIPSMQLTNIQVQKVLRAYWAITYPDDLDRQMGDPWRIARINVLERDDAYLSTQLPAHELRQNDPSYVAAIAADKFGCSDWRTLPDTSLHQLLMTVTARVAATKKRLKQSKQK